MRSFRSERAVNVKARVGVIVNLRERALQSLIHEYTACLVP